MRDILTVQVESGDELIIACDNSGGIGMKEHDHVHVPYETAAYYSFRTAVMECMAAGGQPLLVILHNFCGDVWWSDLIKGIKKGLAELSLQEVPITGSSESNFSLLQSAIGVEVIGRKLHTKNSELNFSHQLKYGVIGEPLVGNEVIDNQHMAVPLSIFSKVCSLKDVMILPVGSKGILYELNQLFQDRKFHEVETAVDVNKSSGPSTCFIAAFDQSQEEEIQRITKGYFHSLEILA